MNFPFPNLSGPAAIAFSGGGDSTAMIHAFRHHPDVTHAFIIDHALREGSAAEAENAAGFARALGYSVEVDHWQHGGVSSGLQVKAREYRYKALGRMCRAAGLHHLLTAHTADDQAETLLMRLDRQTGWRGLAGMPAQAYGALWPALADVTLHRPWLNLSREELRQYNRLQNLDFIDDPSNENSDFTRIRVRQALSVDTRLRADLLAEQTRQRRRLTEERVEFAAWLSSHARISQQNFVETDAVPAPELILHILRAVSGTGGPIDRASRLDLVARMQAPGFKAATLAGAWVVKHADGFVFTRDKVAVSGRRGQSALERQALPVGETVIWDGRFLIKSRRPGASVEPAYGAGASLRQSLESNRFLEIPEPIRPTLPLFRQKGRIIGLGAVQSGHLTCRSTAARRLHEMFHETEDSPPVTV